jgi:hypothetical protein
MTTPKTILRLDGLFTYIAREGASIRANPAARTTEFLQRVFGG